MKPMLSATVDSYDQLEEYYPLLASPKLDGIRALVTEHGIVSRNLKLIPNEDTQSLFGTLPVGLDGELIAGKPWAEDCFRNTSSGCMSVDGLPDVTFYVFDFFLFADKPFTQRFEAAKAIVGALGKNLKVKMVPHKVVRSGFELKMYESQMLELGYEGVMLRAPNGLYKFGRSTLTEGFLMKLKQFKDGEARVLEILELQHNVNELTKDNLGRAKRSSHKEGKVGGKTMGSFLVKDLESGVDFNIGAGFTDAERKKLWADKNKYLGKVIKYKYFPSGSKEKPRFPVFQGFRHKNDL